MTDPDLNSRALQSFNMKLQNRSFLFVQVVLLLVILQDAMGMDDMPYILQRKKMLEEMKITFYPQPKHSKVDKYYYSTNITNKHNYNVTINEPNLCTGSKQIFLLVIIRTHYAHVQWRELIREMLNLHRKRLVVKHVFIFGKSDDPHIEDLVRKESKDHRDIIQEDFPETYLNLLKKVVMAWKWAVNFCPNAEYVMINNDETFIDVEKVLNFLLKDYPMRPKDDHFAICFPVGNDVAGHLKYPQFRNMSPTILYKGSFYPWYCHGWGYAARITVINKLYKASLTLPSFMPTDVYIGVLAEKLRIKERYHFKQYILDNFESYFDDPLYLTRPGMIAVTDEHGNKHRVYETMKNIIRIIRRQYKLLDSAMIHLNGDPHRPSSPLYDFSRLYIFILIFTFVVVSIFATLIIIKLLKSYFGRKYVCKIENINWYK